MWGFSGVFFFWNLAVFVVVILFRVFFCSKPLGGLLLLFSCFHRGRKSYCMINIFTVHLAIEQLPQASHYEPIVFAIRHFYVHLFK